MKLRLKRRAAVALGLLLVAAWLTASCGGDSDDGDSEGSSPTGETATLAAGATVDPNATPDPNTTPTPDATADSVPPLPTLSPERAREELLTLSQNVLFALENAGGLRDACAEPPCSAAVYLQNWETAKTRCERLESYASVKDSGEEAFAGLYDGVEATCASVEEAMGELAGDTSEEEHRSLAEAAIGDLPSLISQAIGESE